LFTFTFPVTETVEPFVFRMPLAPFTVRPAAGVRAYDEAALVSSVPVTVRSELVPRVDARVTVPVTVSA